MKIFPALSFLCAAFIATDCKDTTTVPADGQIATEGTVLNDFAYVVVNPNYQDIQSRAAALHAVATTFRIPVSDSTLRVAQDAWRTTREAWERSEGYLFGPVEDFNYDPLMDSWPVNSVDLDSLLSSTLALTPEALHALPLTLKGFHPIEYILFGKGGAKRADALNTREVEYLISLTQNLAELTTQLRNSWDPGLPENFTSQFVNAGPKSQRFGNRKEAFLAIVFAMSEICDEVANEKMEAPLALQDSTLEESQFSHNSTIDFRNNLTGVLNAYLGNYVKDGHGMNEIVASKNLSLDNTLQEQMHAAILSFDALNPNYGQAIFSEQVQIHAVQNAILSLKASIDHGLREFIMANIKD